MKDKIKEAINLLKARLADQFGPDTKLVLFGSTARNENNETSDVDVLVLLPCDVDISMEERVFDISFEVGLEYDIVFGVIVYSNRFWQTPQAEVMPLHVNISREGISI